MPTYKRFRVSKDQTVSYQIEIFEKPQPKENEVLLSINYSSVNYKDALATRDNTGVLRYYPITPGIDLAGTVLVSNHPDFEVGDTVIANGFDIGVAHDGGFSQLAVIPGEWLVHLPKNLSEKDAMIFGTAGFTAALAVDALKKHGLNSDSRVLVTGATGGVGSFAIHFLKELGIKNIIALSRKETKIDELKKLGASEVIQPQSFLPEKARPLSKQLFDFVIDSVGGDLLSQLIPFVGYGGSLALCGNAAGIKLNTTVLPFILRSVNLLGIDSVNVPLEKRLPVWEELGNWQVPETLTINTTTLEKLPDVAESLLAGTHVGRTIVELNTPSV
ncbi:YhdH/YhfP family quinone oxidoreductase [Enterococcus alishanensis]